MLSKHPQSAPPTLPPGPAPTPVSLLTSAVRKGVLSFPHGSAPGPSALRPSHLREAVRCPSPDQADRLLAALTNVVNLLAAGQAPPTINPFLCGASIPSCQPKEEWGSPPDCRGGSPAASGVQMPCFSRPTVCHLHTQPPTTGGCCAGWL